jgi:hypothetical protein
VAEPAKKLLRVQATDSVKTHSGYLVSGDWLRVHSLFRAFVRAVGRKPSLIWTRNICQKGEGFCSWGSFMRLTHLAPTLNVTLALGVMLLDVILQTR